MKSIVLWSDCHMANIMLISNLLNGPIQYWAVTVLDLKRRLKEQYGWRVTEVVINNGKDKVSYTGDSYLLDGDKVFVKAQK
jgi:hypothetical protein